MAAEMSHERLPTVVLGRGLCGRHPPGVVVGGLNDHEQSVATLPNFHFQDALGPDVIDDGRPDRSGSCIRTYDSISAASLTSPTLNKSFGSYATVPLQPLNPHAKGQTHAETQCGIIMAW